MVTKEPVYKTRKTNLWLSDAEWRKWRVWLVTQNRSSSLVLSTYIRELLGIKPIVPKEVKAGKRRNVVR